MLLFNFAVEILTLGALVVFYANVNTGTVTVSIPQTVGLATIGIHPPSNDRSQSVPYIKHSWFSNRQEERMSVHTATRKELSFN